MKRMRIMNAATKSSATSRNKKKRLGVRARARTGEIVREREATRAMTALNAMIMAKARIRATAR